MSEMNLNELTVLELRKVAKEMKVPLGAGISKQGIIDKLTAAMTDRTDEPVPVQQELPVPEAEAEEASAPAAEETAEEQPETAADSAESAPEEAQAETQHEAAPESTPAQPQFKQAYVAPQRFNSRPAYKAPTNRPSTPRPSSPMEPQRTQSTRPTGYQSRFGPGAQAAPAPQHDSFRDEERPRMDAPRPSFGPARNNFSEPPRFQQRPPYDGPRQSSYDRPQFESSYKAPQQDYEARPAYPPRTSTNSQEAAPFTLNPAASDLAQAVECPEITGVLELLPEGYGFLRSENMIATNRDVYVAAGPIRRFGLRPGDRITGKVRIQRDGDKYPALLTVSQVNGMPTDASANRPNFDSLTPIYPTRRIQLERKDASQLNALRLMDLITPIGFGQRGLLQCPPNTGKTRLLTKLANVIAANHPDAEVMLLLFNETPENVTVMRESVRCQVVASTFDMAPESHLRLADLVIERAERLVEMKRDVVLLVDSLTTLIHVISTAAMQAGRAIPGMISPQSLQKAKRLFGAARCIREGGSLTVIATMNTESGSKADDSVVNDFRTAANMELVLDQGLSRAGVYPPFELTRCGTRHAEAILTPEHAEGLRLLRGMLGRMPVENALRELISMLEKTSTNEELLSRIQAWAEAMKG